MHLTLSLAAESHVAEACPSVTWISTSRASTRQPSWCGTWRAGQSIALPDPQSAERAEAPPSGLRLADVAAVVAGPSRKDFRVEAQRMRTFRVLNPKFQL